MSGQKNSGGRYDRAGSGLSIAQGPASVAQTRIPVRLIWRDRSPASAGDEDDGQKVRRGRGIMAT
ncbi:hypothetical protein [Brachybacterium sp. AOP29-B2-41]|uniref:hypothetical protein n=1 Tax=Brachybacterium sp. AOP29-B2-41 TaxID=3457704 RepID=UPI00403498DA